MSQIINNASVTYVKSGGTNITFPYNINLTDIILSAVVSCYVYVQNPSGKAQTVTVRATIKNNSGYSATGAITGEFTSRTTGKRFLVPVTFSGHYGNSRNFIVAGSSVSSGSTADLYVSDTYFYRIQYHLSFTVPSAGDIISHSGLSQCTRFLTLYSGEHSGYSTQIKATESNRPQGYTYDIVKTGFTTSSTGSFSASSGSIITTNYFMDDVNAQKTRTG